MDDFHGVLDQLLRENPAFQAPNAAVEVARPLLPVTGHEASITQCLSNLLGNAVKFTRIGQVDISVSAVGVRDGNTIVWFWIGSHACRQPDRAGR